VGVADGNVDSLIEVFHPTLSTVESDKPDTVRGNRSNNDDKVSKNIGISSITFCRGKLKTDYVHSRDSSNDQHFDLVPDMVWITYRNGIIVKAANLEVLFIIQHRHRNYTKRM